MSLLLALTVGGIVGILINYFSDVLPVSRRLTRPICGVCNQPYSIKDYFFSFMCSSCGNRISTRSIIVFISAILTCVLLKFFPFSIFDFWTTLPILIFFGVIMVIDIEHRVVLIQTSLFGFVLFSLYGIILRNLLSTIYGALAGFLIMLTFYYLGIALTKIAGKLRHQKIDEIAFGFGDVFLGTILGSLTGWPSVVGAVFLSILAFAIFSSALFLVLILTKKYHAFSNTLPFTIFLIFGAIAIFYL